MADRPILFSAPMVRAILAGTKTQTRRVVTPQPRRVDGGVPFGDAPAWAHAEPGSAVVRCPYGKRGDRLWARETWAQPDKRADNRPTWVYAADWPDPDRPQHRWRPSIHMPRAASRITLEVTGVRVERLQDISEADAIAEGIERSGECNWRDYLDHPHNDFTSARRSYRSLWEQINGPDSWDANPWVWVVEFRRVEQSNG